MNTFPEINNMSKRDLTEAIKLGVMNRGSLKPEFVADLDARIAHMRDRLRRFESTERMIHSILTAHPRY